MRCEICGDICLRFFGAAIQVFCKAECAHAVNDAEIDGFGTAPQIGGDFSVGQMEDLFRGRRMNVLPGAIGLYQHLALRKMSQESQFDLRIICIDKDVPFARNEQLSEFSSHFCPDGNILQIGIRA